MLRKWLIFANLLWLTSCAATAPQQSELWFFYQIETAKNYDDVLAELQVAIAEQNFRITGHSRVGKVIRERGATDYPEYDTIQFCNLTLAKVLLDMSPAAVGYMPCNIVTYQLNGKTVIKTHLLPETGDKEEMNRFAKEMNQKLKAIVDFAAMQ